MLKWYRFHPKYSYPKLYEGTFCGFTELTSNEVLVKTNDWQHLYGVATYQPQFNRWYFGNHDYQPTDYVEMWAEFNTPSDMTGYKCEYDYSLDPIDGKPLQ